MTEDVAAFLILAIAIDVPRYAITFVSELSKSPFISETSIFSYAHYKAAVTSP